MLFYLTILMPNNRNVLKDCVEVKRLPIRPFIQIHSLRRSDWVEWSCLEEFPDTQGQLEIVSSLSFKLLDIMNFAKKLQSSLSEKNLPRYNNPANMADYRYSLELRLIPLAISVRLVDRSNAKFLQRNRDYGTFNATAMLAIPHRGAKNSFSLAATRQLRRRVVPRRLNRRCPNASAKHRREKSSVECSQVLKHDCPEFAPLVNHHLLHRKT